MFTPFESFGIKFRNQILAPPTKENLANHRGIVTGEMIRHYSALAKQGVGTMLTESAFVARQGKMAVGQLGISEEEHLEGLEKLVKAIKKEGACIGIKLSHAGARTSEEVCGENPVGPSLYNFGRDFDLSREFDEGDIEEIILHFVHAAERAQEVGFDFIEINGGDQLLLDQCFSVRFNNRDDDYGSETIENRLRLTCQIIQAIRDRKSVSIPISYYFSIFDKMEDGFSITDLHETLELLEKSGVDIFHPFAVHVMNRCFDSEESLLELIGLNTERPLVADGNIKSPQVLLEVLNIDKVGWYVLEKTLLARPNWFNFLKKKVADQEK
ncbi:MAG: NADH:flavin oxidoreductase [bacterium]|jgi:2,4-dienoyl-CoA reductase-like NADH-dependent reductase (Old Yellow Enzyme family)|nr:MAG: NADH:flavin oxidoreductase [Pseudomonadota bacterium]HBM52582.1 NADH:flavin oxidoreductase [Deltaproteobacteria bacterium]|tara:strand:+ start:2152 stop:3132 length:981 start_codon:yes stop_codon:yes gene_type:complete